MTWRSAADQADPGSDLDYRFGNAAILTRLAKTLGAASRYVAFFFS